MGAKNEVISDLKSALNKTRQSTMGGKGQRREAVAQKLMEVEFSATGKTPEEPKEETFPLGPGCQEEPES